MSVTATVRREDFGAASKAIGNTTVSAYFTIEGDFRQMAAIG